MIVSCLFFPFSSIPSMQKKKGGFLVSGLQLFMQCFASCFSVANSQLQNAMQSSLVQRIASWLSLAKCKIEIQLISIVCKHVLG